MNIASAKEINIICSIPPKLSKSDRCAIDSEWFHMEKRRLHRPHGTLACVTFCFNDRDVYVVTDADDLQKAFDNVEDAVHIYVHAKFDITQIRRFVKYPDRNRLWDCMLLEQIMFSGYYSDFALNDLVRRYLDTYLPKGVRDAFQNSDVMTKEMLEYSCLDTLYTLKVYREQKEKISESDLDIWKGIELPFLWTLLNMQGMTMDVGAWTTLYEKNYADAMAIQSKYGGWKEIQPTGRAKKVKTVFNGLNLNSPAQVLKELHRLGYKKLKSSQEDDIAPFANECEFIQDLLEFRGKIKAAGTYGKGWIENGLIESDGKVYSAFNQLGAATGRLSSSNPNVENIPVRETPDFRKCFVASPGKILVDADWSAQEPRIAAYLSNDEKLIEIFRARKDVYIESARFMFGWEMDKKDPRRSGRMKPTVLGASYGLTEYGMEKKYGVPRDEGKMYLDTFFETFEGMAEYKRVQTRKKDFVTTIYGRKFWLNVYQKGYENNALNSPVQGSAGDAMKIAGAEFNHRIKDAGYEGLVYIINFIHDEILIECQDDETILKWTVSTLQDVMINVAETMHDGIPADVEIKCGHSWHDAH